jgi:hypothetical protein
VIPEFRGFEPIISQVRDSGASLVHDSRSSQVHDSRSLQVHDSRSSQVHDSRVSHVSIFLKSILDSREEARFGCCFRTSPKNLSHELRQIRHSVGVRFSPEFPNTSPSGKWVDSDNLFPRKLLNSGEKRHPRTVGVDTRPPENSQRSNRGDFLKLPPLAPINRELFTVKIFTAPLIFSELLLAASQKGSSRQRDRRFEVLSTFEGIIFLLCSSFFQHSNS